MKKFFHITLFVVISTSVELYPQYDLKDNAVSYPILFNEETVFESSKKLINPEELDSLIRFKMETAHIPGLTALIVKHDSIVWNGNYGYANVALNKPVEDSTLFMVASISKTIMATAFMQLWEDGLFDLEDNINDYLQPDFQVINPYYPNDTITFKMLMTHTSSIDDRWGILVPLIRCGDSPISLDSFYVNYFTPGGIFYSTANFLSHSPSANVWHYTNVGSAILAYVVEKLSGVSFAQYCQDNIFSPLDMHLTSWFLSGMDTNNIAIPYEWFGGQYFANCHQGWPVYPAAHLKTNKIELEQFLSTYVNGGVYNGYTLLNTATIDTMLQVYKYVDPYNSWGLIWYQNFLNQRHLWGHTGGWTYGTNTSMFFHPEEDWGYIMFMNIDVDNTSFWYLNGIISEYAHLFGKVRAINTTISNPYMSPNQDTLIVRTEFLNDYQYDFTANAVCIRSDNVFIDSLALYDDGLHGDSLAGDGIWGGFILPIGEEEIYKVGISTIETQSGIYFYSDDLLRFTNAGPIEVSSLNVTYNSIAKIYEISPSLKNKGQSFTIENIQISMSSDDSTITYISGPLNVPIINPGDTMTTSNSFTVRVDSNFAGVFDFDFEIKSDSWLYWYDSFTYIISDVEDEITVPTTYRLYQNYPNPFNPSTKIKFEIPELTDVELKIYNVLGSEVITLVNETRSIGFYEVDFIATGLQSGVYFYRLQAGDFVETKKMVLLK